MKNKKNNSKIEFGRIALSVNMEWRVNAKKRGGSARGWERVDLLDLMEET